MAEEVKPKATAAKTKVAEKTPEVIDTPVQVEEVVKPVAPVVAKVKEEPKVTEEAPEVIRHILEDDLEERVKSHRIQSTVLPEETQRRNEARLTRIQEITSAIQNAENIAEYESEPAYVRRNIDVKDETPSKENRVSRFGLSSNDNGDSGLKNNSYLHDNVD